MIVSGGVVEDKIEPRMVIPQTVEEMIVQGLDLLTSNVRLFAQAADEAAGPGPGQQLLEEYFRWVKQTLVPTVNQHLPEIRRWWDNNRAMLVKIAEDPMGMLNEHWGIVEKGFERLHRKGYLPSGVTAEDLLAALLLQPQEQPVPPGHPFLQALGLNNAGEWDRITPAQQWLLMARVSTDKRQKRTFSRRATKVVTQWAEGGACRSVSDERILVEEAGLAVGDPASTRFIMELEAKDQIDRLLDRVNLSPSERIVAEGLRKGLAAKQLEDYVLDQPDGKRLSRKSIPVLATKVRVKLRAAAKQ